MAVTNYLSTASADGQNLRLFRSKLAQDPEAGTYPMIQIPRHAFLTDVWIAITEVGTSNTITLGLTGNNDTADTDYLMKASEVEVLAVGMQRAALFPGKWFEDGAGQITMTVGTTQTTGKFMVFANYYVIF